MRSGTCVLLPVNIFLNSARSALLLAGGLLTEETCVLLLGNEPGDITNLAGVFTTVCQIVAKVPIRNCTITRGLLPKILKLLNVHQL